MEPLSNRKIILLALALCLVISVVFAETLITGSHDHDCTGTNCLICLRIEMAKNLRLASIILFFIACPVFSALVPKIRTGLNDCPISPVLLKVRFNT
jgi:cbb3-type cytochrome oxidase subunit 3